MRVFMESWFVIEAGLAGQITHGYIGEGYREGMKNLARWYADGLIDSQLYLLNETPPASFQPYYAGWSKGPTQGAPAVGISHPAGLPKKIQIEYQAPFSSTDSWSVRVMGHES